MPNSRRVAASALALIVTACAAAACGSERPAAGPTGPAGYSQRGPISFVSGKDLSGLRVKEVAEWNASHPNEKVSIIELPEAADAQRQQFMQNAQVKSSNYTIVRLDAVWTAEFAANGWVDELPAGAVDLEGYLPQTIETVKYFGKIYGVPDATGGGLLYYRKDLLDDVGLEPPTTWAEMKKACAAIKERPGNAKLGCYSGQFQKYEGLTVNFSEAVNSAGGQVVSPDGKVSVDSPEAKRALDFLVNSFKDGTIPRGAITWQEEQGRQAFQQGELIFLRNWGYVYALAQKTDGSSKVAGKFDVAPLPGLNGPGVSTLGGNHLSISTFAQNKATAVDFINWINRPEQQKIRMLATAVPPPLESLYTDPEIVKANPFMPTLLESIKTAQPRPVVVKYGDVTLAIQDAVYSALSGNVGTAETLATLQARLEKLVS
jgi:multiple sugar transport system substrate-binding protein